MTHKISHPSVPTCSTCGNWLMGFEVDRCNACLDAAVILKTPAGAPGAVFEPGVYEVTCTACGQWLPEDDDPQTWSVYDGNKPMHDACRRAHNDPNEHCRCPECDPDTHNANAAIAAHEEDTDPALLFWAAEGEAWLNQEPLAQQEGPTVRALADAMPPVDPDDLPF